MELYNTETGAIWKGEPVDAVELLKRGGWAKERPKPLSKDVMVVSTGELQSEPPKRLRGRPRRG